MCWIGKAITTPYTLPQIAKSRPVSLHYFFRLKTSPFNWLLLSPGTKHFLLQDICRKFPYVQEIESIIHWTWSFQNHLWLCHNLMNIFSLWSIPIYYWIFTFVSENIQCSTADRTSGYLEKHVFALQENDKRANRVAYWTQIHETWRGQY